MESNKYILISFIINISANMSYCMDHFRPYSPDDQIAYQSTSQIIDYPDDLPALNFATQDRANTTEHKKPKKNSLSLHERDKYSSAKLHIDSQTEDKPIETINVNNKVKNPTKKELKEEKMYMLYNNTLNGIISQNRVKQSDIILLDFYYYVIVATIGNGVSYGISLWKQVKISEYAYKSFVKTVCEVINQNHKSIVRVLSASRASALKKYVNELIIDQKTTRAIIKSSLEELVRLI